MVDPWFYIVVGAWLMHLLWYRFWYMIDSWYGTSFGTQLILGMVQVDGLVHG
jgi:hypothetical protein